MWRVNDTVACPSWERGAGLFLSASLISLTKDCRVVCGDG